MKRLNKMSKVLILVWSLSCLLTMATAQIKSFKLKTATSLVNSEVISQSYTPIAKSSLDPHVPISSYLKGYDKKIYISYQIAAVNALERSIVRGRASDIMDGNLVYLLFTKPDLLEPISNLANNDFVPLSAYAPLTVKLNFRYNRTKPYNAEEFAPVNNSPAIHTKSLIIKK